MQRSEEEILARVSLAVLRGLSGQQERRREALRDYLLMSLPNLEGAEALRLADMVPPLEAELYARWATMFGRRLLETMQRPVLEELCSGSPDNDAALLLSFVMFLESERMEKQMAADLAAYGARQSGAPDLGAAAGELIRAKIAQLAAGARKDH